jgi:ATP-dependent Lhr-like helicase
VEAPTDRKEMLRGRMEALGPVFDDDPLAREFDREMLSLESDGTVLRTTIDGRAAWCLRRLLARIHRYTLERLHSASKPVSAAEFLRFLAVWQHVEPDSRLEGPRGVLEVVTQLSGFQIPARVLERHVLPARVKDYQQRWLDELALSGEIAWGRLFGSGRASAKIVPITIVPRAELDAWLALADPIALDSLGGDEHRVLDHLASRGASFHADIVRATRLLPVQIDGALEALVGLGLVTCDTPSALRALVYARSPARRARAKPFVAGRWTTWRDANAPHPSADPEFFARALLRRYGVVFIRLLQRERLPIAWRDVLRALRTLEARGEVHGGFFVSGFSGEQFALPQAVRVLRSDRRIAFRDPIEVDARDPLNLGGILTPDAARERFTIAPRPESVLVR